jgi:predicted NUDIX family NTP pyrophosphohydrolase
MPEAYRRRAAAPSGVDRGYPPAMPPRSAGILLYRRGPLGLEILLAHPGGPYWQTKDEGAWGIAKGEMLDHEDAQAVAMREFEEETGHPRPAGPYLPLGEIRKKSGKVVVAWGAEGDVDPAAATSNTVQIEWPPRSKQLLDIPEVDRVEWFDPDEARRRIQAAEAPFIDRLLDALGD